MEDGRIIILGQTATAGFDLQLVSGEGLQLTSNTIFRAPSISIADESGNLIERYLFPIPKFLQENTRCLLPIETSKEDKDQAQEHY